jgi:hypothetical protein
MLKTGDEIRATNRERLRRCRAKQAARAKKYVDQGRIVQFIITVQLPFVRIRREVIPENLRQKINEGLYDLKT